MKKEKISNGKEKKVLKREESAERIEKVKLMGRIDISNLTKERGVSRL